MHANTLATLSASLIERLELKAAEFHALNNQPLLTSSQVNHLRVLALAIVICEISDHVTDHCGRRLDDLLFPADVVDEPTRLPAELSRFLTYLAAHTPANVPSVSATAAQVR